MICKTWDSIEKEADVKTIIFVMLDVFKLLA
jgi:hypothetical protein